MMTRRLSPLESLIADEVITLPLGDGLHRNMVAIGTTLPMALLAGPSSLQDRAQTIEIASNIKELTDRLGLVYVFKAPSNLPDQTALKVAIPILAEIRETLGIPVMASLHEAADADLLGAGVDIIALTDSNALHPALATTAAKTGKPISLSLHSSMPINETTRLVEPIAQSGNRQVFLTLRHDAHAGAAPDLHQLPILAERLGAPVVVDATPHSADDHRLLPSLARAAAATGIAGLSITIDQDMSAKPVGNAQTAIPLRQFEPLLAELQAIDQMAKARPCLHGWPND